MRKKASVLLLEIFLIIVGVLLGLAANDWRETRNLKKQANLSLKLILEELQHNQTQIDNLLEYHTEIRERLNKIRQDILINRKKVNFKELKDAIPKGFSVPLLRTTAWELANRTSVIENIDYETASELAVLYRLQDFYQKKIDKISDNFYIAANINPGDMSNLILALSSLAGDILIQEQRLTKSYGEIIAQLKKKK